VAAGGGSARGIQAGGKGLVSAPFTVTIKRSRHFQLDALSGGDECQHMEKKVARVFERIRHVRGLSVEEKYLFARSLAATPDERWRLHQNFLRSHGLFTHSERRRFGFK